MASEGLEQRPRLSSLRRTLRDYQPGTTSVERGGDGLVELSVGVPGLILRDFTSWQ